MTEPTPIDRARRRGGDEARVPPHNLQAERSLLGAMLLSRDARAVAIELCQAGDFYAPAHGHVFEAMRQLTERGDAVDTTIVANHLTQQGLLEETGGAGALGELITGTPAASNAERYARILVEHATLRATIGVAGEIAQGAYDLPESVEEFIDGAEQLLFTLRRDGGAAALSLADGLTGWLEMIEARRDTGGLAQHPTGWHDFDEITGGLHPSQLMVVAARPGMGKTSAAGQLVSNVAQRGEAVLFVSIEMSYDELLGRFVALEAHITGSDLSRGRLSARDWERVDDAVAKVRDRPIDIADLPGATLGQVRAAVRRAIAKYRGLGLVVVDYLQLMAAREVKGQNREREVAELARGLKVLAREMEVPVVALAQLNRGVEMRGDKRPMLSDLRESGDIENSADVVVFIYRDEYYKEDTEDKGIAEFIVAKNRHGPLGTVKLSADLRYGRWSNMARSI